MAIELSTAIVISIASLLFSIYVFTKNDRRTDTKDIEERVKENTKINMKLDAIMESMEEFKNERISMQAELNTHTSRIVKVEESAKQAHHRLDTIEQRLNIKDNKEE